MFVVGNFIDAIATILGMLLQVYFWIVIVSALLSWVNPDPNNPIVRFLRTVTEPAYRPIRKFLSDTLGVRSMIDISPIVVILIIIFLQEFVVRSLHQFARNM
ncbi:MAG: YggT family protein [Thermodesulfovibrionales bacterium]|nr:YggT family protein [Thermodesulfovibrionales bacterium]